MKYLVIVIICCLMLTACSTSESLSESGEWRDFKLNTVVTFKINDHYSDDLKNEITSELTHLEKKLSRYISTSEVAVINKNAGLKPVEVSEDTLLIIEKAKYYSEISGGQFDVTMGPVIDLWQIGTEDATVPAQHLIDKKIGLVDHHNILLDGQSVYLQEINMSLDLGGIAKGYAADQIVKLFEKYGVVSGYINLGGNIIVYGPKEDGTPWNVGIRNPFKGRSDVIGTLELKSKSIVTSGPYEKYFMEDGIRYHHILDPQSGFPVTNEIEAVTVISNDSIDGDALTTSIFALGIEAGLELVASLDHVECIIVTNNRKIYLSNGMKASFHLSNEDFEVINE